ncbi:hypothetical protein GN956_G19485 [Arapaima gigas]
MRAALPKQGNELHVLPRDYAATTTAGAAQSAREGEKTTPLHAKWQEEGWASHMGHGQTAALLDPDSPVDTAGHISPLGGPGGGRLTAPRAVPIRQAERRRAGLTGSAHAHAHSRYPPQLRQVRGSKTRAKGHVARPDQEHPTGISPPTFCTLSVNLNERWLHSTVPYLIV